MPVGSITPGSRVTVTADASPTLQNSSTSPTATMPVTADDMQSLMLLLLNNDKVNDTGKVNRSGDTVTGNLIVQGFLKPTSLTDPATVRPSDADHTLNTQSGGQYFLLQVPSADRTITLQDTGLFTPTDQFFFDIRVPLLTNTHVISVVRETPGGGGNKIATLGDGTGLTGGTGQQYAGCRCVLESGVWRLQRLYAPLAFYGADA